MVGLEPMRVTAPLILFTCSWMRFNGTVAPVAGSVGSIGEDAKVAATLILLIPSKERTAEFPNPVVVVVKTPPVLIVASGIATTACPWASQIPVRQ